MRFYSYLYLRENDTPYYAGKGSGRRAFRRFRYDVKPPKDLSKIVIFVMENESLAFESEKALIELFGRKDNGTGILRNRTDGGEGTSGAIRSDDFKRKISAAHRGRHFSAERRAKLSAARVGIASPRKGVKLSAETKYKLRVANLGKPLSLSHRDAIRKGQLGHGCSNQTRAKMRESRKIWWIKKRMLMTSN